MRAAIYIRVSTDEQAEEGYSLDEQRRACEAYVLSRGWTVAEIYADEGLSAFSEDARPALTRLLADVRTKRYQALVVHKLDRFFRRLKLLIGTVEDLETQKCAFISVSEQIDFTTPAGRMMLANLGSFAEYYSRNLSAETMKGLRGKARAGNWVGPTPYGYDRHERTLIPNADAPTVQQIFARYASGVHSFHSLADYLNDAGLTTHDWRSQTRGRFGRENIRGILRNPAYVGMVRCKEVLAPGNHPALVDQATWDRCQQLLTERTTKPGVTSVRGDGLRPGRLLSGLVRCAACDAPMWLHTSQHNEYYRCAGRDHRTCQVGFVRADRIEAQALDVARAIVLPSAWRAAVLSEAEKLMQPEPAPRTANDPDAIRRQLERLALVYADGDLTKEVYDRERSRLKTRLSEASAPTPVIGWSATHAAAMLDAFASLIDQATFEEQRALLRELFATLWIAPHEIVAQQPKAAVSWLIGGIMGCPMGVVPLLPPFWLAHKLAA